MRPALTRLLVVLLLLQWGSAFGNCLGNSAAGSMLTNICTPDGLRTIVLDANGQEAPATSGQAASLPCPVCAGAFSVAMPEPMVATAPPILLVQATPPMPPATPPPAPPRSCIPPPQAPPTS